MKLGVPAHDYGGFILMDTYKKETPLPAELADLADNMSEYIYKTKALGNEPFAQMSQEFREQCKSEAADVIKEILRLGYWIKPSKLPMAAESFYRIRRGEEIDEEYIQKLYRLDKAAYEPDHRGNLYHMLYRWEKNKNIFVCIENNWGEPVAYVCLFPCSDELADTLYRI